MLKGLCRSKRSIFLKALLHNERQLLIGWFVQVVRTSHQF